MMSKKKKRVEYDGDAALLAELATLDEVSAHVPYSTDQDQGKVPGWCELILELRRDGEWPITTRMPMRRHDGELIIEVLHRTLHPTAGGSVADGLWLDLDAVMERLMTKPKKKDIGLAQGLTIALARLESPFKPDEDAVKEVAIERYYIRHAS